MGRLSPVLGWGHGKVSDHDSSYRKNKNTGADKALSSRPGAALEDRAFQDHIDHWVNSSAHFWKLDDNLVALTREPVVSQEQLVSQKQRTKPVENTLHNGGRRVATVFVETSVECSSDCDSSRSTSRSISFTTNGNSDHAWQNLGSNNMPLRDHEMQHAIDAANEARAAAETRVAEARAAAESLTLQLQQMLEEKTKLEKKLVLSQAKCHSLKSKLTKTSEILNLLQSTVYR